jgi:23S rRNA (cytidine1920-2'-O)/16S rRNA (cytidine1409-2'-O)-methyltransferase
VKLAAALDRFSLSPQGHICLDIGASTGGFTDVLLQRGAKRVYAVDVGHGQMKPKIATDPRVVGLEGVNARALEARHVPEPPSVLVADVSFISLKLALPAALGLAAPGAWAVFLVKPQFELGPDAVPANGVVRDEAAQAAALAGIIAFVTARGWNVIGTMESPIAGATGNREFLLAARYSEGERTTRYLATTGRAR